MNIQIIKRYYKKSAGGVIYTLEDLKWDKQIILY